MARPRSEETRVVTFRVPLHVYEELLARAERKGLSLGSYLRDQLTDAVDR